MHVKREDLSRKCEGEQVSALYDLGSETESRNDGKFIRTLSNVQKNELHVDITQTCLCNMQPFLKDVKMMFLDEKN